MRIKLIVFYYIFSKTHMFLLTLFGRYKTITISSKTIINDKYPMLNFLFY